MAFGFPAYHTEKRQGAFDVKSLREQLVELLEGLGWIELGYHPDALDYRTLGSAMTMAERILIFVSETEVKIHSECLFPAQFLDFGKNQRNVTAFWEAFDKLEFK